MTIPEFTWDAPEAFALVPQTTLDGAAIIAARLAEENKKNEFEKLQTPLFENE